MYQFSDSDSKDSDDGIRFKTDSTRNKLAQSICHESSNKKRRRSNSKSPIRSSSNSNSRRKEKKSSSNKHRPKRQSSSDDEESVAKNERGGKGNQEILSVGTELPSHLIVREPTSEVKETPCIGPVLPPHLIKPMQSEKDDKIELIGPALPPHLRKNVEETNDNITVDNPVKADIGPELPPHLKKPPTASYIGPTLPPHLRQKLAEESHMNYPDDESEDESYGPLPEGISKYSKAHLALEERALQLKMDQICPNDSNQPAREEWMLELPAAKASNFGLGPRQFRSKAGPDLSDRSSWTDTPEDKAKKKQGKSEQKVDLRKEAELKEVRRRDKEQEIISKKHKKHKDSLVDMHRKKLKEKEKEESGPSERKPFNRETDLQVNRFDEAQKKAVLKKAQLLDTRFSTGESKFL